MHCVCTWCQMLYYSVWTVYAVLVAASTRCEDLTGCTEGFRQWRILQIGRSPEISEQSKRLHKQKVYRKCVWLYMHNRLTDVTACLGVTDSLYQCVQQYSYYDVGFYCMQNETCPWTEITASLFVAEKKPFVIFSKPSFTKKNSAMKIQ